MTCGLGVFEDQARPAAVLALWSRTAAMGRALPDIPACNACHD